MLEGLIRKLEKSYRVLVTGLGFAVFFTASFIGRFTVFPLFLLLIRDQRRRELTTRKFVCRSFRLFIRSLCALRVMDLVIEPGQAALAGNSRLICPSHPTLIDAVILHGLIENANCIVKAALKNSYALKSAVSASGYIANNSGTELVQACARSLALGDTLVIFPEGTRSVPGQEPKLKHGAAAVALEARCNITPVRITCTPPTLMKNLPWYKVPESRMLICVRVLPDIDITPYLRLEEELGRPAAVRRLTEELRQQLFPTVTAE